MPYSFKLVSTIPASPEAIYDAWLDSAGHSKMTGGEAKASDKVGGAFTAWDGYIWGKNIELVRGKRIVQSWRTSQFTDADPNSILTVTLANAAWRCASCFHDSWRCATRLPLPTARALSTEI